MKTSEFVVPDGSRPHTTKSGVARYYFGERHAAIRGPQGFMNETGPGSQIRPHFHHENQFQVFFGSRGATFQRREIPSLMLHYSEAGTAYGPISSGEDGLDFFTLRQNGNEFTGYLPEDNGLLDPARRRRHFQIDLADWLQAPIPDEGKVTFEELIPDQDDTLNAFAVRAGAGAKIVRPAPEEGQGQYYVVVTGSLEIGDEHLVTRSLGWCDRDADSPELVAGPDGARLLVLRFGEPSTMAAAASH